MWSYHGGYCRAALQMTATNAASNQPACISLLHMHRFIIILPQTFDTYESCIKQQNSKIIQIINTSMGIILVILSHNIIGNYVAQIVCLQKINGC